MPRRTRHRRRYHTDRIVAKRRARYLREGQVSADDVNSLPGLAKRLSYGALANRDPWDCGRPRCGVCHGPDPGRRANAKRAWQLEWL